MRGRHKRHAETDRRAEAGRANIQQEQRWPRIAGLLSVLIVSLLCWGVAALVVFSVLER